MLWELMRLYDWRIITCPTPAFEMLGEVGHVGLYSSLGMRLGTLIHDESTAAFTVPQLRLNPNAAVGLSLTSLH